jgi:uncharacterized protein (TIGR03435 family)
MRAVLAVYCSAVVWAQPHAPDPALVFEAASLRPSGPGPLDPDSNAAASAGHRLGGPGTSSPGRIFYSRTPLRRLIMDAYQVQAEQVSGPEWLDSEKFDITANVRKGATKDQVDVMLQNLLKERFKLVLHKSAKEGLVYDLTVAKGGPKMKAAASSEPPEIRMARNHGLQRRICRACSIADLIRGVEGFDPQRMAPERIVDRTGLTGRYNFILEYESSLTSGSLKLSALQNQAHSGEDIFVALEKQLGLTLKQGGGPVELLIVDQIERTPSAN